MQRKQSDEVYFVDHSWFSRQGQFWGAVRNQKGIDAKYLHDEDSSQFFSAFCFDCKNYIPVANRNECYTYCNSCVHYLMCESCARICYSYIPPETEAVLNDNVDID